MSTNTEEAPLSTMPYPPLHQDKKFVVLSDWLVHFTVRSRDQTVSFNDECMLRRYADRSMLNMPILRWRLESSNYVWPPFVVFLMPPGHDRVWMVGTGPSQTVIQTTVSINEVRLLIPTDVFRSLSCASSTRTHGADMTDNLGYGMEKRRQGNLEILSGRETFRYARHRARRRCVC